MLFDEHAIKVLKACKNVHNKFILLVYVCIFIIFTLITKKTSRVNLFDYAPLFGKWYETLLHLLTCDRLNYKSPSDFLEALPCHRKHAIYRWGS